MAVMTPQTNKFIFVFSGLMIAAVAFYYAYVLADRYFLAEKDGTAVVAGKEYRPLSKKYQIESVGGRTQTIKMLVPEAWLLTLDLGGKTSQAECQGGIRAITEGARMDVRYKQYRISRKWQVTKVAPMEGE